MANYLYNGVELPALPAFPTFNNKELPYAIIVDIGGEHYAHCSANPITYNGEKFVVSGTRGYAWIDLGEWTEFELALGGEVCYANCVWSNHDILDADGSVWLAASEPTPVPDRYLYNGIELPNINTVWTDKTAYPYAYMMCNYLEPTDDQHLTCYLIISSAPLFHKYEVKSVANKHRYLYTKTDCRCVKYTYSKYDDMQHGTKWFDETASEVSADNYAWRTVIGGIFDALWCTPALYNYDDNTLYLAASDPVPVPDEPETVLSWQKHDAYKPNAKWDVNTFYRVMGGKWVKQGGVVPTK